MLLWWVICRVCGWDFVVFKECGVVFIVGVFMLFICDGEIVIEDVECG